MPGQSSNTHEPVPMFPTYAALGSSEGCPGSLWLSFSLCSCSTVLEKLNTESFANSIVFRKIADVKKEEEERRHQKNEVTLSIPVDHPVRRLFQKFKQQKEMRVQGSMQADLERNQFQVEHQLSPLSHHQHHRYRQHQMHHPLQHPHRPPMQNGAAGLGGGRGNGGPSVMTISQITPVQSSLAYVQTEDSNRSGVHEALELKPSLRMGDQNCLKVTSTIYARGGGGGRGWMRLRNTGIGASFTPPPELDQQQREEEWGDVNQSLELLSEDCKNQQAEGGECFRQGLDRNASVTGSGNTGGEGEDEKNALHKTDSCDSGITKSDLRIDRAGDPRSPMDRSPLEQPSPGAGALTPQGLPFQQPLLQSTLQEAKLELKGDIQTLSGRLSVLEAQVGEILRLLSDNRRPGPPQTSTPKTLLRCEDIFTVSRPVTPDAERDDGPF
ncbi:hypothetical protein P4O66_001050 [Electrophorus voltai]|uniref:Uncharacterized protein n=1 Tax=Electrophorus voltai TaxID=2609070 RepID=A0AAD8Z9W0_9TELE|nr:hypothetical protein P4O66_001050 [Electrophorus voltai]